MVVDAAVPRQLPRLADGHRGDIQSDDLEATLGQPDGGESAAARDVESPPGGREIIHMVGKDVRRANRTA